MDNNGNLGSGTNHRMTASNRGQNKRDIFQEDSLSLLPFDNDGNDQAKTGNSKTN